MTRHQIYRRMAGNPARIKAYDRRSAAIHEAGHALMAVELGYDADAWIYAHETSDPLDEKTWLGHTTIHGGPGDYGHPHSRMVAVAGMVAEILWKNGRNDDYAEPYGWEDYLMDGGSMSYSDWRMADCEPGEPDADLFEVTAKVGRLFMSELWPTLTEMSRMLMSETDIIYTFGAARPIAAVAA